MKILEFMSFNPSWFLTIPGILITVGIILLIISLILLLTGKDKVENKAEEVVVTSEQNNTMVQDANTAVEPVVVPSIPSVEEQTLPVDSNVNELNMEVPIVENNVTNTEPVQVFEPVSSTPSVEPVPTEQVTESKTEPTLVIDAPSTPSVSIYGGVNPSSDLYKVNVEEPKPTIYGGANPLENTAPIPTMSSAGTYNIPNQEAKIVEPAVQEIEPTKTAVIDNGNTPVIPASINDSTAINPVPVEAVPTAPSNEIEELEF